MQHGQQLHYRQEDIQPVNNISYQKNAPPPPISGAPVKSEVFRKAIANKFAKEISNNAVKRKAPVYHRYVCLQKSRHSTSFSFKKTTSKTTTNYYFCTIISNRCHHAKKLELHHITKKQPPEISLPLPAIFRFTCAVDSKMMENLFCTIRSEIVHKTIINQDWVFP